MPQGQNYLSRKPKCPMRTHKRFFLGVAVGLILLPARMTGQELFEHLTPTNTTQPQGTSVAVKGDWMVVGGHNTELYRRCFGGYQLMWYGRSSGDVAIGDDYFAYGINQIGSDPSTIWVNRLDNPNGTPIQVPATLSSGFNMLTDGDQLAFAGNDLAIHTGSSVVVSTAPSFNSTTTLSASANSVFCSIDADMHTVNGTTYREVAILNEDGVSVMRRGSNWGNATEVASVTTSDYVDDLAWNLDVALNDGVLAVSSAQSSGGAVIGIIRRSGGTWGSVPEEVAVASSSSIPGYHIALDTDLLIVSDYVDLQPDLQGSAHVYTYSGSWSFWGDLTDPSTPGSYFFGECGMDADDGHLAIMDHPTGTYYIYDRIQLDDTSAPTITNTTLSNLSSSTNLTCSTVTGANKYKFHFTTRCGYVRNVPTSNPYLSVNQTGIEPCATYDVQVAHSFDGGTTYSGYGPAVTFTRDGCDSSPFQLTATYCGAMLPPFNNTIESKKILPGHGYQFGITGPGITGERVITSVQNAAYQTAWPTYKVNMGSLVASGVYSVRVRKISECYPSCTPEDEWSDPCDVTNNTDGMILQPGGFLTETDKEELSVWPNPSETGHVNLFLKDLSPASPSVQVQLLDALGKVVYRSSISTGGAQSLTTELDLGDLVKGLYVVQVLSTERQWTGRLLLE
jgi:hypothetical protein